MSDLAAAGSAEVPTADPTFDGWEKLDWRERRARRFARWRSPAGVEFASGGVRAAFEERVDMVIDAIELRKPARVPVVPATGAFLGRYAGLTVKEMMYDYDKLAVAYAKYHDDFIPDFQSDPPSPAPVFDLLGGRFLAWPGHGVPDDQPWQYLEAEYMTAAEYDELIADPSAYFMRKLLPRFADAYAGLASLDPFSDTMEASGLPFNILGFADPAVVESVQRLHEAANATLEFLGAWMGMAVDVSGRLGIPLLGSGMVKAPYDIIADTLRGTKGIVMDRYRRPQKILAAAERFVPLQIDAAVRQAALAEPPLVWIPLHKGADGFMSDADFREFYWPTLKALVLGMIEQGIVPMLFAEGGYNERLEAIADDGIPAGSVLWWFDQTDMAAAKQALGGRQCIAGNVPSALLALGSGDEVAAYVTGLLDEVAGDGGVILTSGAVIDDAKAETVKAMIDAGRAWRG